MAVNIGPKIGIDGEKEYRKQIQDIIQQGKTLSAEMNEAAAAFANANDKEKAGAEITKKLNEQIENQKKLVEKLEDAVKKSTEKTGENSSQTMKWKEQLAKAKTELHNMESTANSATDDIEDLGKAEDKASEKTSIFGQVLKANLASEAIKKGLRGTAKIVKDLVDFFGDAVKGASEYADEIVTLDKKTGIGTDTIQEWKYAAGLIDVSFETIEGSLTKLKKNMDAARDGSSKQATAFADLGIEVKDANGELRDSNEVFDEVIDRLRKIENHTERDAAAMDIFGKSAEDLNPLIESSVDDLESLRKEAHTVGAVMDNETLQKLNKVQDGFDRLGATWESIKRSLGAKIGIKILPDLNKTTKAFQKMISKGDIGGFVRTFTTTLGDGILRAVRNLTRGDKPSQIGKAIGDSLGQVFANGPKIIEAGIKLVGGLLKGIILALPNIAKGIEEALEYEPKDDPSEQWLEAQQRIEELRERLADLRDEYGRVESALADVDGKQREAEYWLNIYDQLASKTSLTSEEQSKLRTAVERLIEVYPQLGNNLDEETGKFNLTTNAIRNQIQAMADLQRANAYYDAASDALKDMAKLELELEKVDRMQAEFDIDPKYDRIRKYNEQLSEFNVISWDYYHGLIGEAEAVQKLNAVFETNAGTMNEIVSVAQESVDKLRQDKSFDEYTALSEEMNVNRHEIKAAIADIDRDIQWLYAKGDYYRSEGEKLGKAIDEGIEIGISKNAVTIVNTAGALMSNIVSRMKSVAMIKSPSKRTRDEIGKNLGLGVVKGFDDVMTAAKTREIFAMTPIFDAMTAGTVNNNNSTTNMNLGGVNLNVYARDGESVDAIVDKIMLRMQRAVDQRKAVLA